MFTVCPKCALTLVVTAADLRVAQGYVRCGRCSSVFNALARLSEERGAQGAGGASPEAELAAASALGAAPEDTPDAPAEAPAPAAPRAAAPEEDAIPEDALEFNPAAIDVASVFIEQAPDPQWSAATGSFKAIRSEEVEPAPPAPPPPAAAVEVELDAALLAAALEPRHAAPAPREPESEPRAAPPPPSRAAPSPAPAEPLESPAPRPARHGAPHSRPPAHAAPTPPPAPTARQARAAREAEGSPAREEHRERIRERRAPRSSLKVDAGSAAARYAWGFAAALALLGLLAQIAHHHRDELAAIAPLARPLTALYTSLGLPLAPRWDLRAYDVRQLGASAEPGAGLITVRASIKNGAPQPQPLPLLRVTLQDRFGNRIAARDVAPRYYLPRAGRAPAYLSAGERIDAEMGFVDPGANAVGFEIDACLTMNGAVTCAADAAPRP